MRLSRIYRYPVKGFTPEPLTRTRLEKGAGIPYDRACAFVCGNLPDPPVAGGWVPARTFFQLTVFPELVQYTAEFDDSDGRVLTVTAPDGSMARADLDMPAAFAGINRLIRDRLPAGPHAIPELFVQLPGHGQWDFSDSAVSIINLASVRALSQAIGSKLDPLRFRGNLFIDDVPAWHEFSLIGRRLKVGEAEIEVMRPAMRCAATTVDPSSGDTDVNVPVHLRKLTGHLFCGVYARVVKPGEIASASTVADLGEWNGQPGADLPGNAPDPTLWPRFAKVTARSEDSIVFENPTNNWPFINGKPGDVLKLHGHEDGLHDVTIIETNDRAYTVAACGSADTVQTGQQVLFTGPFSK